MNNRNFLQGLQLGTLLKEYPGLESFVQSLPSLPPWDSEQDESAPLNSTTEVEEGKGKEVEGKGKEVEGKGKEIEGKIKEKESKEKEEQTEQVKTKLNVIDQIKKEKYYNELDEESRRKFDEDLYKLIWIVKSYIQFKDQVINILKVPDSAENWEEYLDQLRKFLDEFNQFNPIINYDGKSKKIQKNDELQTLAFQMMLHIIGNKDNSNEHFKEFISYLFKEENQDKLRAFISANDINILQNIKEALEPIDTEDISSEEIESTITPQSPTRELEDTETDREIHEESKNEQLFNKALNAWFAKHLYDPNFSVYLARLKLVPNGPRTTQKILSIYVENRFGIKAKADQWTLDILYQLRKELLSSYYIPDDKTQSYSKLLAYIDQLEEKQFQSKTRSTGPKPLWSVKLNPYTFSQGMTFKDALTTLNINVKQNVMLKQGVSDQVLRDVFRVNGHESKNPFLKRILGRRYITDLYIGDQQVIFNMNKLNMKGNNLADILGRGDKQDKENITNQWNQFLGSFNDSTLKAVINTGTYQQLINFLPMTMIIEELKSPFIRFNENVIDPKFKYLKIKSQAEDQVIYEVMYEKKDKNGNLIYELSSDVIVQKTGEESEVRIIISNPEFKAYSDQVKYIFPSLYNRNYLENKLKQIEENILILDNVRILDNEKKGHLKRAIRAALRYAGEVAAAKLSPFHFEKFVKEAEQKVINEINSHNSIQDLRFEQAIGDVLNQHLKSGVREIIQTNLKPDVTTNEKLRDYYLDDIKGEKSREWLTGVADKDKALYPIDQYSRLLANALKVVHGDSETFSIPRKQIPFVKNLYDKLSENEQHEFHKLMEDFIEHRDLENIDTDDLTTRILPNYLIKFVLKNRFKEKIGDEEAAYELSERLAEIISPQKHNPDNLIESRVMYSRFLEDGDVKHNIETFADAICKEYKPNEVTKKMVSDILFTHFVSWQLQHDQKVSLIEKIDDEYYAYFEGIRSLEKIGLSLEEIIEKIEPEPNQSIKSYNDDQIRSKVFAILQKYDDEYLLAIVRETLGATIEGEVDEALVLRVKGTIEDIGKEMLPVQGTWIGNTKYIQELASIIAKKDRLEQSKADSEGELEVEEIQSAAPRNINDEALLLTFTQQIMEDIQISNRPGFIRPGKWPEPYYNILLPRLKKEIQEKEKQLKEKQLRDSQYQEEIEPTDSHDQIGAINVEAVDFNKEATRIIAKDFAELMFKEYKKKQFEQTDNRKIAAAIMLIGENKEFEVESKDSQIKYEKYLKEFQKEFSLQKSFDFKKRTTSWFGLRTKTTDSSFVPDVDQQVIMIKIAATNKLHNDLCQLFEENSEIQKSAKTLSQQSNLTGVKKFFSELTKPGKKLAVKSTADAWKKYLLAYEEYARKIIEENKTETLEDKEKMRHALKLMSIVNSYRYARDSNVSKLAQKVGDTLAIPNVNNNVGQIISRILRGSGDIESQIVQLRELLAAGKEHAKQLKFFSRLAFNRKLNALDKLIVEVKKNYVEDEVKLLKYEGSHSQVEDGTLNSSASNSEAGNGIEEARKEQPIKKQMKEKSKTSFGRRQIESLEDQIAQQEVIFNNHDQSLFRESKEKLAKARIAKDRSASKSAIRTARETLAEEIVDARIAKNESMKRNGK